MLLIVNGSLHTHCGDATLASLLAEWGADPRSVAVMVNDAVLPRPRWPETRLNENDRVEILVLAAGG